LATAGKKSAVRKEFTVSMAVDGRIDVTVEAETAQEAFEKAKDAFTEADLSRMETVDSRPVNAYDNDTRTLTDYE
jgi:SHS2 domain-containing protein